MQPYPVVNHLGLKTALPQPPGNSAKSVQNFVRHPHNGWLEQADGYGQKYALPASDTYTTLISIQDIHNFYVKEHGGKQITICVGTYKKKYRHSSTLTPTRVGLWARPYWNGSAWTDSWLELTEVDYFSFSALSTVGGSPAVDVGADYSLTTDYYKNWIISFVDYSAGEDHDNYLLCQGNTIDSGGTEDSVFKYFGNTSDITARSPGALVLLARNFFGAETPASLSSHIFSYLNEIRATTGNTASDMNFMAGFRTKTFGWATTDGSIDKLFAERACLDIWRYAFAINNIAAVTDVTNPIDNGNYNLKCTLLLDDGNETELRQPIVDGVAVLQAGTAYGTSAAVKITTDGTYQYIAHAKTVEKVNPVTNATVATSPSLDVDSITDIFYSGGYIYVFGPQSSGANSNVIKIDVGTMTVVANYLAADDGTPLQIVVTGGFVYALSVGGIPHGQMLKINASTMAYVSSPSIGHGASPLATCMAVLGADLVVGYDGSDTIIDRLDGGTLSVTSTITLTGYSSVKALSTLNTAIGIDGPILYAALSNSTDQRVLRMYMGGAPSIIDYVTVFTGSDTIKTMTYDGSKYSYVSGGSATTTVYRIDTSTMSLVGASLAVDGSYPPISADYIGSTFYVLSGSSGISIYPITLGSSVSIASNGYQSFSLDALISPTIPKRSSALRIYISSDKGVTYYLIKEVSLLSGDETWDAAAYWQSALKHFYRRAGAITIDATDIAAIGALSTVTLGRTDTDSGSIKYLDGTVVGGYPYVIQPLIGSPADTEINKLVVAATGGGAIMPDVFPNDVANVINLEYSDGDQLVAARPLADRILALKKRSIVLVNFDGTEYLRDQVSKEIGCCSSRTARAFDDVVYFCDYNGIFAYDTSKLSLINADWLLDWKALTIAQKEAAIGVIDTINRKYIVYVASKVYVYQIDSGEWMMLSWAATPLAFAHSTPDSTNPGSFDFLTSSYIENIAKATQQDGSNFTASWESNEINVLLGTDGYALDVLVQQIIFEYQSDVDITATVYLDGSATAFATYTLSHSNTRATVLMPLSAICKTYRVKYSATTTGASQVIKIKARVDYFDKIPMGGDVLTV